MPFDWWTKRVRVNKPIDWANTWSLEAQARGLSFEMDDQMNLKAIPVVVVDTTCPNIIPARQTGENINQFMEVEYLQTNISILTHYIATGGVFYITRIQVDYADAALAVPAIGLVRLSDSVIARWEHRWWCGTPAVFRPSFTVDFYPPLRFNDECFVHNSLGYTTGGIYVSIWGYNA